MISNSSLYRFFHPAYTPASTLYLLTSAYTYTYTYAFFSFYLCFFFFSTYCLLLYNSNEIRIDELVQPPQHQ